MGSLLFGEIVEPDSRALIEEEFEYPEYEKQVLNIEGNFKLPNRIDVLIFMETENVKKLVYGCTLKNKIPLCQIINVGIDIYQIEGSKYIIVWSQKNDFSSGEVVELLEDWLQLAKTIYTVTSSSIGNYQNYRIQEKPATVLKVLSNDDQAKFTYTRLESPNLVTGLAANVLSYCIHSKLKCTLFVAYIDLMPLDSVNMGQLIELFKEIKLPVNTKNVKLTTSSSNLYM